jgi:hypothetical protein
LRPWAGSHHNQPLPVHTASTRANVCRALSFTNRCYLSTYFPDVAVLPVEGVPECWKEFTFETPLMAGRDAIDAAIPAETEKRLAPPTTRGVPNWNASSSEAARSAKIGRMTCAVTPHGYVNRAGSY